MWIGIWRLGFRVEDWRFDIWDWELGIRDRGLGIEIISGEQIENYHLALFDWLLGCWISKKIKGCGSGCQ